MGEWENGRKGDAGMGRTDDRPLTTDDGRRSTDDRRPFVGGIPLD